METTVPTFSSRHAVAIATALLTLSVGAAAATIWVDRAGSAGADLLDNPQTTAAQLLCFGIVGAVLIARRPDLPFGWLLGVGAVADIIVVGVGVPALALAQHGHGGEVAIWGVGLAVLQWIPAAVTGIINVRFPSGRPASAWGHRLDRAIRLGIVVGSVGDYLGDSVTTDLAKDSDPLPAHRFIDGSWITPIGNAAVALVPLVILLGTLAGVGVIIRFFRAQGIERKQLQWRAAGAAASLVLFPAAVAGLLPDAAFALDPLVLVTTLVVPVLRYQLWSGVPVPRRRKVGPLVSRRTLIEVHEEERRRLRRELHDGLGPLLTGMRLNLDAAQGQIGTDASKALEYLSTARQASADAISDLRGLVRGLRPPALDELGLAGALGVQLSALTERSKTRFTFEIDDVPAIPAAVEVALYRTTTEAVTNVVRHSKADHCVVSIRATDASCVLNVDDDGTITETWTPGVGLTAMQERAAELGGSFLASSGPDGFHIQATYPGKLPR
jgi:signal transduction histidine kinase